MRFGKTDLHLHAISVHFTNALYPVAAFFLILYLATCKDSFRSTYSYLMILATISVPLSYLTGVLEWRHTYKGAKVRIFLRKIRYGFLVFVVGGFCTLWYWLSPDILERKGIPSIIFIFLNFSLLFPLIYVGHLGGKLTFRGPH